MIELPDLGVLAVLRHARARQDLLCTQIAERAGLHPETVSRLLRGRTWHWPTVRAVARVLRVEIRVQAVEKGRAGPVDPGGASNV